jgi:phosphatidylinositol-3,4,5-trisphosphate 3-phosphatase and dual-specificity protein phosphatase PTEN
MVLTRYSYCRRSNIAQCLLFFLYRNKSYLELQRKLPSPGFQLEVVLLDYDGSEPLKPTLANVRKYVKSTEKAAPGESKPAPQKADQSFSDKDEDKVFSDNDGKGNGSNKNKQVKDPSLPDEAPQSKISQAMEGVSLKGQDTDLKENLSANSTSANDFKAIAADTSVFSFGDDEDYESE